MLASGINCVGSVLDLLSAYKDEVSTGAVSTGVSGSPDLLLLRVVGEVVIRIDSLVEEPDAVQVVIHRWGSEIARSVPQKNTALVVVGEFLWRQAYGGIFKIFSISVIVVEAFLHLKRSFQR